METSLENLYVDLGGGLKGQRVDKKATQPTPFVVNMHHKSKPHLYLVRVLDMDAKAKFLKKETIS